MNNEQLDALKTEVSKFPKLPGVYIMKGELDEVIYVGKALNLRSRVRSYFSGGDGRSQIEFLMRRVCTIEKIVTENESQAFVLERDLIKKFKPKYNIRLKDDTSFLSIRLDKNENWPRLQLVRKIEQDGAMYFGPFSFSYELRSLLDIIKRVVPLRTCTNSVFYNRQRPCLEYQINRCLAPCCLDVDTDEYADLLEEAVAILEGRTKPLIETFHKKMEIASEQLNFEEAASCRDRIKLLENFKAGRQIVSSAGEDRDIFALYREEQLAVITVLKVRLGRIAESENFVFKGLLISDEAVVESAVEQYYDSGREVPEEVLLSTEIEEEQFLKAYLKEKRGKRVDIASPKRGSKFRLINLSLLNAKEHFNSVFNQASRYQQIAEYLSLTFKLSQIPRKVECLDISNFQGSDIVGAIVTFYDGIPDKAAYKRFKISQQEKPDDFGSINEVVLRRLDRGMQEDNLPDLLIIDGGRGQLNAALKAREERGIKLDIISLAKIRLKTRGYSKYLIKSPERIFTEHHPEPIRLKEDHEATKYLQRVRDEAHRFVITFHRARRSKSTFQSLLDTVPGIGPERKRRLFKEFVSIEKMGAASIDELAKAGRMSKLLAENLRKAILSVGS